jgi:hypothetical protein
MGMNRTNILLAKNARAKQNAKKVRIGLSCIGSKHKGRMNTLTGKIVERLTQFYKDNKVSIKHYSGDNKSDIV